MPNDSPKQFWAWPRHPLSGTCSNMRVPSLLAVKPGHTFSYTNDPVLESSWGCVIPPTYELYRPCEDDLELLQRLHPDDDPNDPPWERIAALLRAAGCVVGSFTTSPELLALLAERAGELTLGAGGNPPAKDDGKQDHAPAASNNYSINIQAGSNVNVVAGSSRCTQSAVVEAKAEPAPLPSHGLFFWGLVVCLCVAPTILGSVLAVRWFGDSVLPEIVVRVVGAIPGIVVTAFVAIRPWKQRSR